MILSILLLLAVVSCRKQDIDMFEGPSLEELNTPFKVKSNLTNSQDAVDFSSGESVYFTAEFSKTIDWKLRIIGLTSGAEKIVNGTSKTLDAERFLWDGSTTNLPVFRAENCDVELTFLNEEDTLIGMVEVLNPKNNSGFLISDFESGFDPGWTFFIQSGLDMDFQVKTNDGAAQGDAHYNMAGTVDWDWLVGLVNFNAPAYGAPHFPLNSNGDNVYFNVMVYGEPGFQNSVVLFQFEEDENGDETFNAANEDMYAVELKVDWEGWQLISLKYSDIVSLVNGQPAAASGNDTHNPDKIIAINMLHLADPASGYAKSKLDYIIFTENGPLNP